MLKINWLSILFPLPYVRGEGINNLKGAKPLLFFSGLMLFSLIIIGCTQPLQSSPSPVPEPPAAPLPTSLVTPSTVASPAVSPVITPTRTITPEPQATPAATPRPALLGRAQTGKQIFSENCARCHGTSGEGVIGPALIGQKQGLVKYRNAQELINFVRSAMPQDAPGSLPEQDYWDVLAFILQSNRIITVETLRPEEAASIALTK